MLYAATDGVDSGDGLGWATATTLQGALAAANGNTAAGQCFEIRVKQGVYKPTATTDHTISFAIRRPLQIKGGYTGNAAERQLNTRNTVLSGDIGGDDTVDDAGITATASDIVGSNSNHVLTIGGTDPNTSTGGRYTADAADASYTLVEGVTITGGQASNVGGGGGGLYCNGRGTNSVCSPAIRYATFSGNLASFGGAIFNDGDSGTSSPTITNTTFSGNSAGYYGGAISNSNYGYSGTTITNTTFSRNSAGDSGGAIYNNSTSNLTITASILWDNTLTGTRGSGPEIYNVSATPTVKQSIMQVYSGTGSLNTNPLLGRLQDNGGPTFTMLPGAGSPAIDAAACNASGDQRGITRPQGAQCDIGAVERLVGTNSLNIAVVGIGTVSGGLGACASTSSSCSAPYGEGDPRTVTLSATPATGSTFSGWTGACTNTSGDCVVTMDAARNVTATFVLQSYPITASASPTEGGSVVCAPNPAAHGSSATCTASPATGYRTSSISGCAGTATGVGVNSFTTGAVTAACTVTAQFERLTYAITGSASPAAGGSVVCAPNPAPHGSSVTCTASPNSGYTLSSFTGCDSVSGNTCSLSDVTAARSVAGTFVPTAQAINPTPVPTLSQWALELLSLLAAALGLGTLRRRGQAGF